MRQDNHKHWGTPMATHVIQILMFKGRFHMVNGKFAILYVEYVDGYGGLTIAIVDYRMVAVQHDQFPYQTLRVREET